MNLTVYDKGMIKGIEKGREEGREEGREQGQISGLISGLMFATELKFGRTDPVIAEKLNALSSLDEIGRAQTFLKQASTPEEFLRDLARP
ncbi:hypothetical protein [Zavarzinella formosa]|uniref:hypothetical protein n=1 Tax=Zavarzinella formosa TaxID=360055 RepID=UPI0012FA0388|nr:hypothetical protein [Zavarzinella formosa]